MNEAMQLTLVLFAGMLLGTFFFGGLWWTVRRGLASPSPALWFIGSLLLRLAIVLPGFYFVAGTSWQHMMVCVSGFIIARVIITRLTALSPAGEASDAS